MADVLDVEAAPGDPQRPVVGGDDCPSHRGAEVRQPLPCRPGQPQRDDSEYRRGGTGTLVMVVAPQPGWRHVAVPARRPTGDGAPPRRARVDAQFPEAAVIRLGADTLQTHGGGSLAAAFPAAEARRIAPKRAFHPTPTHGRWLTVAAVARAVRMTHCRDRRLGDRASVRRAVAAWEEKRNAAQGQVHWRFGATDARTKLVRLYPVKSP